MSITSARLSRVCRVRAIRSQNRTPACSPRPSCTKTFDESKTIAHYLPELRGIAFEYAPLRHVMNGQTGLACTGLIDDGRSSVRAHQRACRFLLQPGDYAGPQISCDYLRNVKKERARGKIFHLQDHQHRSDGLGDGAWTGRSLAQLLQERNCAAGLRATDSAGISSHWLRYEQLGSGMWRRLAVLEHP